MKLLIAENDRQTREDISMAFKACQPDWELVTSDSFKGCMGSIKKARPDIVILCELDDMSNIETIKQIRRHSEVPLMALVYNRDSSVVVEAFNAGADGVMTRPDHQLELVARTKAILRRRKGVKSFRDYSSLSPAGGNQGVGVSGIPPA